MLFSWIHECLPDPDTSDQVISQQNIDMIENMSNMDIPGAVSLQAHMVLCFQNHPQGEFDEVSLKRSLGALAFVVAWHAGNFKISELIIIIT